ncbi:putative bifunctional diguanylate cyclase/phosphodiesterase [Sphingomonas edaphi]|nr:EAL domain-containing protein [Sphingomonas edaphi]
MTIDRALGIPAETAHDNAILRQRFIALKKQFPWVYGIFVANLMGLHFTVIPEQFGGYDPTIFFLAFIGARAIYWLRNGNRRIEDSKIQRELRASFFVTLLVCATFCAWVMTLYGYRADTRPMAAVMFSCLTSIGACYGLSSFPASARAAILILNLPMAALLIVSGDPIQVGAGLCLILLSLLILRMLTVQDRAFLRLVSSRYDIEEQRTRAIAAETVALAEQERVGVIAHSDQLTGLANRRGFLRAIESDQYNNVGRAVAILDLDGFKPINDTFGHPTGDQLLLQVGERLSTVFAPTDLVARLGGDEFAILFETQSADQAFEMVQRAVALVSVPYELGGRKMMVSACGGLSFRDSSQDLTEVMREADIALYTAKGMGRGVVESFSLAMRQDIQRRTAIEQALRQPGTVNDVELAFQPIFHLETLELRAFEALARWKHSELGWISPAEFIPITEQLNVIEQLTETLLGKAAEVALQWPASIRLSFNLSPVELCTDGYAARVLRIIREAGLSPQRLQVEVTETALFSDFKTARKNLAQLSQAGARIALDDFGAGYSSINYLREINFDTVKLDGSLVSSVHSAHSGLPLLRGVLALCKAMGQQCIAEHIETEAQLMLLRQLGCRYGQGFGMAEPVSAERSKEIAQSKIIALEDFATALRAS